jgi:all-trans-retinol 13,14-reductase
VSTKYDIVIIGSGLGGLETAYILSKEGYNVCVLEKNKQIGGNLQTFARDKCIFDTGVHYIGGLAGGQNLNQFFKYFGLMEELKVKQMNEVFDIITFDGDDTEYKIAQGYDNFYHHLAEQFPREKQAIKNYINQLQTITKAFPLYNLEPKALDESDVEEYTTTSAKDFITSITDDKKLQNVLAGNNMLYAGDPDTTPLHIHALIQNSYIQSAWKMINGGSQIARILNKRIKENGGDVRKQSEVTKLGFEGKTIRYVELADGEQIPTDYVISNVHPAVTMQMIEEGKVRKAYRSRITSVPNQISMFSLHLTLEKNSFPYYDVNYYHFKHNDVWHPVHYKEEDWPASYLFVTPAHSKSETYADAVTAMTYMRYEEVQEWDHTFNTVSHEADRGEDYRAFKERKAQAMIDELANKFPGIRDSIRHVHTSTPLSYRDYIYTVNGSAYGVLKDYKNPLQSFIPTRTKIPNLYLTGQNVHVHGMLGVTVSAILTASEFTGLQYLMDKIKKA